VSGPPRLRRVLDEPADTARPFVRAVDETSVESDEPSGDAAERELQAARERGYREGRERALEELSGEIDAYRGEFAKSLERLAGLEQTMTREHEERLLEIVVETASRIVRQRIEQGDPVAARALSEALEILPAGSRVRARIHPEDVDGVSAQVRAEIESGRIELLSDDSVTRGGSIVESDVGRIDAAVETAERTVRDAILGEERDA